MHARYACRHSGACCTAGWNIPVEPHLRQRLGTAILVPDANGACEHFDRASRLCRLQRDHGVATLPASCHHFPRRALIDDRGTFVGLSHFCPTAASLLFESPDPLAIVENPPGFPATREYDGLDARGHWPPLLRQTVLFDLESYGRWERFVVRVLAGDTPIDECLDTIAAAAERVRAWGVHRAPLIDWVDRVVSEAAERGQAKARPDCYRRFEGKPARLRVRSIVPAGLQAPEWPEDVDALFDKLAAPGWDGLRAPIARYLAAKAFGSWTAYQAQGVRTLVAELVAATEVLRTECARVCAEAGRPLDRTLLIEAIRASDLLLIHLVDREAFVSWLGQAETD